MTKTPSELIVSVDDSEPISWKAFLQMNDMIESDDEARIIRHELEAHGIYKGGGGAAAEFTIKLTDERNRQ